MMMPVVTMPDGAAVNFPDDMPPDQIKALIAEKFPDVVKRTIGTGEDVARSAGIGLAKGAIGLAGIPGDIGALAAAGAEKAGVPEQYRSLFGQSMALSPLTRPFLGPTSQDIQKKIEETTGKFYEPQTRAGRYTETAASFVPGAVAGPLSGARQVAGNVAKYALAPGAASEFAGEQTKGTALEPWARAGAAVGVGGAASLLRPGTAESAIRNAIPQNIDRATINAAEQLFQEATRAGQPITRAEAIQYVTQGGTQLGDLQRVVEGQGGLKQFFAGRAEGNQAALGDVVASIAPQSAAPSTIGPNVGRAATQSIDDVRNTINTVAEPFYTAAAARRIPAADMGRLRRAPGWPEARDAVRNDPQLARYVVGLPDNSVGFVDEVKKYLNTAAENARGPLNAQRNQQRAAGYGSDAALARGAGISASTEYETALAIQEHGRRTFLEPLLQGPLGKMAKDDTTTKQAIGALFPANPIANAQEIEQAVTALAARNPLAARQLVRAHVQSTFNEASQNLIGGANQFGGAKFAAAIRGNPQQAENLEAAVRALPNGDNIWNGFDRFLHFVEAQGTRQRIGSQTAFNQEVLQDLRRGTPIQEAGAAAATVGIQLPRKIKDTLDRWRLGRGVDEIGALLTNPEAANRFRQIASMPSGSREASMIAARLVALVNQSSKSTDQTGSKKGETGR